MKDLTLVVPYYRQPAMLREQIGLWNLYGDQLQIILVDDGSPEPAEPIVRECAAHDLLGRLSLYRIDVDIPWNRGGARNLAAKEAQTDWVMMVDIDHVLPVASEIRLMGFEPDRRHWYRFGRFRHGAADETRQKDKIPKDARFGRIHPHIDSYLCTRDLYWRVGGYDEDYSGCLGGGSPFLAQLEAAAQPLLAPAGIDLYVYTRSTVSDSSDLTLSRDRTEYANRKRRKQAQGKTKSINPIRFPWRRIEL